ncbi:MAG: cob(I)yrinic acid a,c-diamide adenosyltransferase [Candidatus Acetothermia bacterium]
MTASHNSDQQRRGYLLVFTGPGKGKTTSAVGSIIRALGHGLKPRLITFFKGNEKEFPRGTFNCLRDLGVPVENYVPEHPNFGNVSERKARSNCQKALQNLEQYFQTGAEDCDLLVLDEINVALSSSYIDEEQFLSLLDLKPPHLELICTGRDAPQSLIEKADLVSKIDDVKHFYRKDQTPRLGYEY